MSVLILATGCAACAELAPRTGDPVPAVREALAAKDFKGAEALLEEAYVADPTRDDAATLYEGLLVSQAREDSIISKQRGLLSSIEDPNRHAELAREDQVRHEDERFRCEGSGEEHRRVAEDGSQVGHGSSSARRKGIGEKLLKHLETTTRKPVLIGTWADAAWAIRFYEKNGYRVVSRAETDRLLRRYWSIPERQIETSVVLAK